MGGLVILGVAGIFLLIVGIGTCIYCAHNRNQTPDDERTLLHNNQEQYNTGNQEPYNTGNQRQQGHQQTGTPWTLEGFVQSRDRRDYDQYLQDFDAQAQAQALRRRLQGPIVSLARETGCDILNKSSLPRPGKELNEIHMPEIFVPQDHDPWGPPGLNDHNLWWIIPVSCLTQLMWIYVAYKIYKKCSHRQTRDEDRPQHELREITVRR